MTSFIGVDSPELLSPAIILRAFGRAHDAAARAEARFNSFCDRPTAAELADPTPVVKRQLGRLVGRFEQLLVEKAQAEALAMRAMRSLGADANLGGVRVDGRLFAIVQDDEAPQPTIVVVVLARVRDL